jgi:hypothetical protein
MQTFLPEPSIVRSAQILDYKRLGKQRVEAKQILMALRGESTGWTNHPAVKMWRGHEGALCFYGYICCAEWIIRGYKDSLKDYFRDMYALYSNPYPSWFGDPDFHRSHQSNLVRKYPEYYRQFWPDVPDNLPYVWPGV